MNGVVNYDGVTTDSTAQLVCSNGYIPGEDSGDRMCLSDGNWSVGTQTCVVNQLCKDDTLLHVSAHYDQIYRIISVVDEGRGTKCQTVTFPLSPACGKFCIIGIAVGAVVLLLLGCLVIIMIAVKCHHKGMFILIEIVYNAKKVSTTA